MVCRILQTITPIMLHGLKFWHKMGNLNLPFSSVTFVSITNFSRISAGKSDRGGFELYLIASAMLTIILSKTGSRD